MDEESPDDELRREPEPDYEAWVAVDMQGPFIAASPVEVRNVESTPLLPSIVERGWNKFCDLLRDECKLIRKGAMDIPEAAKNSLTNKATCAAYPMRQSRCPECGADLGLIGSHAPLCAWYVEYMRSLMGSSATMDTFQSALTDARNAANDYFDRSFRSPFRESNLIRDSRDVWQGIPFLRRFRWYRWFIGGKWAFISGLTWYGRWIHVEDSCTEDVDEDWGSDDAEQ